VVGATSSEGFLALSDSKTLQRSAITAHLPPNQTTPQNQSFTKRDSFRWSL